MINLSKSGDTIVFQFINNGHYLENGTIEVPINSLSLVTDSSNMATFYKADSGDIFISATYDELGKTKAEMLEWFEENMVAPQGGGGGGVTSGQVQTMIDDSVSGYADSVLYNSTSKYVEFYHGGTGGTKVYEFDATDFIVDGMVDDVKIETISGVSYLVIDFNTASGKEDIQIPLTDIFNPSNYYTKTEVDGIVSGKTSVVNLTQAEYDALVTGGTVDPTVLYNITDATPIDMSQYWTSAQTNSAITQAVSGKADSSAVTQEISAAVSGKQDTLSAGTNITIVDNVISAEGGGKAIEAGRGISVTTGETADTVSFNLPISAGTGNGALIIASDTYKLSDKATGNYAVSLNGGGAHPNYAQGNHSHAEGADTSAFGEGCHSEGHSTSAGTNSFPYALYAHAEGEYTHAAGSYSHTEGYRTIANNASEHASGGYNVSNKANNTWGDSGNTLFSVGNGTADNARHNAFEIRQNGDIYITSGGTDIKLQDNLGGGGGGGQSCTVEDTYVYLKYRESFLDNSKEANVKFAIMDYEDTNNPKSGQTSWGVYFRLIEVEGWNTNDVLIYFDYTTSSYTFSDQSYEEYFNVEYDETIEDFKVAIASTSGYNETYCFQSIFNLGYDNFVKVPFYHIASGSPCSVIETQLPPIIAQLQKNDDSNVKNAYLGASSNRINLEIVNKNGQQISTSQIKLEEIDGNGNTLKPDIKVGLGTSAWTEVDFGGNTCLVQDLNYTSFRITYSYEEGQEDNLATYYYINWGINETSNSIQFDENREPSISSDIQGITSSWDSANKVFTVTYPTTYQGETLKINSFGSNSCQLGQMITKFETYGENTQPLKPYVQETRAALGGLKLVEISQADYDLLPTKDPHTLYVIPEE